MALPIKYLEKRQSGWKAVKSGLIREATHNGEGTKRHKAQDGRRHKTAYNLGSPLLIIAKNT
jgi:hypothetical protein